jgi:hypothetical protein
MKVRVTGVILALVLGAATSAQSAHQSFHVTLPLSTGSQLVAGRFAGQNVALSDFVLKFSEPGSGAATPEHPVKALGVMPVERDFVRFTLQDRDADDGLVAEARFVALGSGVTVDSSYREGCDETCELSIRRPTQDQAFVLAGFELGRHNVDGKLRKIAISALPERGLVRVTFADGAHIKYDARVRYALIPKSLVSGYYTVRGEFAKGRSTIDRRPGTHVLQGFSAEFKSGPRALHRISLVAAKTKFELGFRDQDAQDPFRASIDYVILN